MLGFKVTNAEGGDVPIAATSYTVEDDGSLAMWVGDERLETIRPGDWLSVEPIGRPLSASWPPPQLQHLLGELDWIVGGKYGQSERVGSPATFASPLLNELDAFMDEVGARIGLSAGSTDRDDVKLFGDLRAAVLRHLS